MSGASVHHNVISNATRGIYTNGGSLNKIYNNVLNNCESGIRLGANDPTVFKINDKALNVYAEEFFANNPVYESVFGDLSALTASNYQTVGLEAYNNTFNNCTQGLYVQGDVDHEGNPTDRLASFATDKNNEPKNKNNTVIASVIEGLSKADIDVNDIGIITDELDRTIAYAEIDDTTVTVWYVSTYNGHSVIAAVKDHDGKIINISAVSSSGESFEVPEGAESVDLFVFDSLDNIKPITKK